jgi:hypothetical protein
MEGNGLSMVVGNPITMEGNGVELISSVKEML